MSSIPVNPTTCEQCAIGIDAALLVLKIEAGETKPVDRVGLLRRQTPLDPYKTLARGQLFEHLVTVDTGQRRCDLVGRHGRVEHLARIGVERGHVERRRQQFSVTVDDIGAFGHHRRNRRKAGNPRHRDVARQQGHLRIPGGDHQKRHYKQQRDDLEPRSGGVERAPCRTVGHHRCAWRRLEMPRTARIVVELKGGAHHRLSAIWAISSLSEAALRAGRRRTGLLTAASLSGRGRAGRSSATSPPLEPPLTGAAALATVAGGAAAPDPSIDDAGVAAATTADCDPGAAAVATAATAGADADGGGGGGTGRSGKSSTLLRNCLVASGTRPRNR